MPVPITASLASSLGHAGNLDGLNLGDFMTKQGCSKAHGGWDVAVAPFVKLQLIPGGGSGNCWRMMCLLAGGVSSGAQHSAAVVGCLGEPLW